MKNFLVALLLLISPIFLKAEQTFHGDYRTQDTFFVEKEYPTEILRGIIPSRFYVAFSSNDGLTWTTISDTIVWGEEYLFSSWKPTELTETGRLGIFTEDYITKVWGLTPYDITESFVVSKGILDNFGFSKPFVNYGEGYIVSWTSEPSTLPTTLVIETKTSSTSWTHYKTISNNVTSFTEINENVEPTYYRITTPNGIELVTGLIDYVKGSAEFENTLYLENTLFDFERTIEVTGTYDLNVLPKLYVEIQDTLLPVAGVEFTINTFKFPFTHYGTEDIVKFYVMTRDNQILDVLSVNFINKEITLSSLKSEYVVNEGVYLKWWETSNTSWDALIKLYVKYQDGSEVLFKNWELTDGEFTFYFHSPIENISIRAEITDGIDIVSKTSTLFSITDGCQEDLLALEIDSLKKVLTLKDSLIASKDLEILESSRIIDSLKTQLEIVTSTTDSLVFVVTMVETSVKDEIEVALKDIVSIGSVQGDLLMVGGEDITSIYIYDIKGSLVYVDETPIPTEWIDISGLTTGTYIVIYYTLENGFKPSLYKFVR